MADENDEDRKHSPYSPSKASTWLNCPASVILSQRAPKRPPHPSAAEGTKAHKLLEDCLRARIPRAALLATREHDSAMVAGVQEGIEYVREIVNAHPHAVLRVEEQLTLAMRLSFCEDPYGYCDINIYDPASRRG